MDRTFLFGTAVVYYGTNSDELFYVKASFTHGMYAENVLVNLSYKHMH